MNQQLCKVVSPIRTVETEVRRQEGTYPNFYNQEVAGLALGLVQWEEKVNSEKLLCFHQERPFRFTLVLTCWGTLAQCLHLSLPLYPHR